MTKIEDMIKELCPNGVEWKELGEVCEIIRGSGLQKKDFVDTGVPCIHYGQIYTYYDSYVYETKSFISQNLSEKLKKAKSGDLIIATTSENIEDVGKSIVWLGDGDVCIGGHSCVVRTKENPKYIHYCMQSIDFQKQKEQRVVGTKVIELYPKKLSKIKIPIPPLKVQEEIVKILDKFTDYVTELTSELTLRQKQYSFYRDKLLSFEDEVYQVEWKNLEEVANLVRGPFGGSLKKEMFVSDGYAVYEQNHAIYGKFVFRYFISSEKYESLQRFSVKSGDLIMSCSGTIGKISIIPDTYKEGVINQALLKITPNPNLDKKYLKYYFESVITQQVNNDSRGGAIKNAASVSELKKLKIPVPSLEIQSRIVQVLDNFDTVCNDLNIGLPKEIELRQKQYEYFRDKLLTFTAEGVYTDSTVQYRQDLIRLLQWVFGPIKVSLGSICSISRGKRLIRSQLNKNGKYPVYQNSLIPLGYFNETNEEANTTFVISAGAAGEIGFSKQPFWKADDVWTMSSEFINQRFLYYMLLSNQSKIKGQVRKASIPRLSKNVIENLTVCLPESEGQSRIVSVLDKFDTLTNSISEGLPKEINQRQKQYEYFRDKLLTF